MLNDKLLINLFLEKKLSKALPNRTMKKKLNIETLNIKWAQILKMIDQKKKKEEIKNVRLMWVWIRKKKGQKRKVAFL